MPLSVGLLRQSLNAWCRSKTPPDIKAAPLIIFINIVGTMIINVREMQGATLCGGAGGKTARVQDEVPGRVQGGNPAQ